MPIWIFDEDGELYKFVVEEDDLVGYGRGMKRIEIEVDGDTVPDGSLCVCEVLTFRVLQLAFSQLWPEDVPDMASFAVRYGHPSKGSKATFEYVTRAFTRGAAELELAEGVTSKDFDLEVFWYEFTNTETGETFETHVLEGVFPDGFFDLRTKVKAETATEAEEAVFSQQWEEVRDKFLTMGSDELFDVEEEEAESPPYWPIAFSLGLTAVLLGTIVVSVSGRRK
ncbi:MAG: hypothetical protein SVP26_11430 [Chloroflexota bacterium]|nr:hypothetical protein [Chloroflexota bacterium]